MRLLLTKVGGGITCSWNVRIFKGFRKDAKDGVQQWPLETFKTVTAFTLAHHRGISFGALPKTYQ